ncbi:MAG: DinB family protein [Bacteroidota bacterium]
MDAYDLIKEKISYNQWANKALIGWLKDQSEEVYEKEISSSFPSLNKVFHHLLDAQLYYFSILTKAEGTYEKDLSTKVIFDQLLEVDGLLVDWIQSRSAEWMDEEISLKRSPFVETYSVATLITHLLNHSTYHRGQIVAMRYQLGIDAPPRTDYYRYIIAEKMPGFGGNS